MAQSKVRSKSRIPEFASREEAAAWFDTHDMADYQDEFKTVRMRLANNLTEGITIRLDPQTLVALRTVAQGKRHRSDHAGTPVDQGAAARHGAPHASLGHVSLSPREQITAPPVIPACAENQ